MPITLTVKSDNEEITVQRETAARRVLDYFGSCLPASRLLCFLDDADAPGLKRDYGPANRGGYVPVHDNIPLPDLPDYVTNLIFFDDGVSLPFPRVVDDLVYLHGSTCGNEVGLTMTLAHELQHAIQHANLRKLWAINGLAQNLHRDTINALKLTWTDIPIELEARVVSKRVAVHFFGEQRVEGFIDQKISERMTDTDVADWQFIRTLTPTSSVNIDAETKRLVEKLRGHRSELEAVLHEKKGANNPDFLDIELSGYF